MRRTGVVLCLSILIVILAGSFSFADGYFTLEKSYPEDGGSGFQPVNMAVKLYFSENVASDAAQQANKDKFTLTDSKGKVLDYTAIYNEEKDPNYILIYINETLASDMEYTLSISEELVSSKGNVLDAPETIHFTTRNTATDSSVSMGLMMVMMVGMVGFMVWDSRRRDKKKAEEPEVVEKFNPYKIAKETGKSVEEVIAQHEKQKAKEAKKKVRNAKEEMDDDEDDDEEEIRPGVFHVSARRPISAAGGKTPASVSKKKAAKEKAEAIARENAARSGKTKSKGSKQQQKKKK